MDINGTTCSQLRDPISYQESAPLLSPCEQHYLQKLRTKVSYLNFIPRQLWLPSKAAVLILFWTAVIGAITKATENAALHILDEKNFNKQANDNFGILMVYLVFVLVYFLYPLAGFLADVYYGRYKIVTISLCLLLFGNGCFCVTSILIFTRVVTEPYYTLKNIPYYVITVGPGLFFMAGFSGYQANFVQLGLDQLLDAPRSFCTLVGSTYSDRILHSKANFCSI